MMKEKESEKGLALLKATDLAKVENSALNAFQLQMLLKKTPQMYIKKRPAKGGGQWSYVSGGYIRKCLNVMFGWDWDFEIMDKQVLFDQVVIEGKLTCRSNGRTIVKMQIGTKEIMFKRGTKDPLNIGNDFKAAATDALKKCAAELGLAADVYNAAEFKEVILDLSNELTPTEIKRQKDIERFLAVIKNAKSVGDLTKGNVSIDDFPECLESYNEKMEELRNG